MTSSSSSNSLDLPDASSDGHGPDCLFKEPSPRPNLTLKPTTSFVAFDGPVPDGIKFDLFLPVDVEQRSPSRQDGVSLEAECALKREMVTLIQRAAAALDAAQTTAFTATVYLHRFFMRRSLKQHDPYMVMRACLFLACKAEETNRRLRDVINVTWRLQHPNSVPSLPVCKQYWDLKDLMIQCEHTVLTALEFDLEALLPHKFMLHQAKKLQVASDLVRVAWCILNDGARTSLSLLFPPHIIAAASLHLAASLISVEVVTADNIHHQDQWWSEFGAKREQIDYICGVVLDLYERDDGVFCDPDRSDDDTAATTTSNSADESDSKASSTIPNFDRFKPP